MKAEEAIEAADLPPEVMEEIREAAAIHRDGSAEG